MAEKTFTKGSQLEKTRAEPDYSSETSAILCGHECEFVDKPPKRSECPICLLVLREPLQATCCGKIFCKTCICNIRDREHPCPTCKTERFDCYPDKGLQQELYSCRVYCPKKAGGCDWESELRELDQHLNLNPEEDRKMEGCGFVNADCVYCVTLYKRCELHHHQSTECVKRLFTCETCQEYKSTYNDVVLIHHPLCKCRPVDCPNQCGVAVQHQKLEQHLSNNCDLAEVECQFVHAGCEAKICRKDLSSHLSDSMVSHMSLLVAENRQLKSQLEDCLRDVKKSVETFEIGKQLMIRCFSKMPPFHIRYPVKKYVQFTRMRGYQVVDNSDWFSEHFYSHFGGYELRLKVKCTTYSQNSGFVFGGPQAINGIWLAYEVIGDEFQDNSRYTIFVTTSVLDLESGTPYVHKKVKVTNLGSDSLKIQGFSIVKCVKSDRDNMEICVERIEVLYA